MTTTPATFGTCGRTTCHAPADLESQVRIAPTTWTVSLSCFTHATSAEIAAMEAAA